MPDIQIDVSEDPDDDVSVENTELSNITVAFYGVQVVMDWRQAENLYRNLRPFFEDEPAAETPNASLSRGGEADFGLKR